MHLSGVSFLQFARSEFLPIVATLCLTIWPPSAVRGGESQEIDRGVVVKERIARAWDQRRRAVPSARFVWKRTHEQTAMADIAGQLRSWQATYSFQGDRQSRYEVVTQVPPTLKTPRRIETALYIMEDLGAFKAAYSDPTPGGPPIRGSFSDLPFATGRDLYPMHWHYQFGPESRTLDLARYDVASLQTVISDVSCHELHSPHGPGHGRPQTVYVAASDDCRILRCEFLRRDGSLHHRLDMEYTLEHGQWHIAQWKLVRLMGNELAVLWVNQMLKCELTPKFTDLEFQMGWPVGCWVQEEHRTFIQLGEGQRRIVTDAELQQSIPYNVLLQSSPATPRSLRVE